MEWLAHKSPEVQPDYLVLTSVRGSRGPITTWPFSKVHVMNLFARPTPITRSRLYAGLWAGPQQSPSGLELLTSKISKSVPRPPAKLRTLWTHQKARLVEVTSMRLRSLLRGQCKGRHPPRYARPGVRRQKQNSRPRGIPTWKDMKNESKRSNWVKWSQFESKKKKNLNQSKWVKNEF